jgi:hypothetical protein
MKILIYPSSNSGFALRNAQHLVTITLNSSFAKLATTPACNVPALKRAVPNVELTTSCI